MKEVEKNNLAVRKIIKDIKDVKIQGANNIAISGIKASLLTDDKKLISEIYNARKTEPLLHNSLEIISASKDKHSSAKKIENYINSSREKIAKLGASLIKNDMNVFSHCHSSTVMDIFKYAKNVQKKTFTVYTLEVEPLLQGRKTAKELAKEGINVVVFPDLAADHAMSRADIFFFGVDAFMTDGVLNKIGTSILAGMATRRYKISTYTCGVSLKFAKSVKIEHRSGREVWDEREKKITVVNPAFDFTKRKYITKVISELGILKYKDFIKESKKTKKKLSIN